MAIKSILETLRTIAKVIEAKTLPNFIMPGFDKSAALVYQNRAIWASRLCILLELLPTAVVALQVFEETCQVLGNPEELRNLLDT